MRKTDIYLMLLVLAGITALSILNVRLSVNSNILAESLIAIFCLAVLSLACFRLPIFIWIGILVFSFLAFASFTAMVEDDNYLYAIIGLGYSFIVWRLVRQVSIKSVTTPANAVPEKKLPPQRFIANETEFEYPLLLRRVQSLFIDGMLLLSTMMIIMLATENSFNATHIRISTFLLLTMSYEPLLTAYGHTLGQRIMGIRVRNVSNPSKRINVLQSYLRFIVKNFFGWISFVTIHFNPEHRAIHDFAGSSVMIKAKQ